MHKKVFILFSILFLVSCGSQKPYIQTTVKNTKKHSKYNSKSSNDTQSGKSTATNSSTIKGANSSEIQTLTATTQVKVTTEIVLAYIERFKGIAIENNSRYGIPASITLAQGILESGAGTGPLSVQANNHFGIKCHKDWNGDSILHDDDTAQECFRKYADPNQSYSDHAVFLVNRKWYASLFKLDQNDYKGWAKGLKDAGYATDPKYPDKLIGLIEKYHLEQFDRNNSNSKPSSNGIETVSVVPTDTNNVVVNDSSNTYTVLPKDTLYSISKKTNTTVTELKELNNLTDTTISVGQILKIK